MSKKDRANSIFIQGVIWSLEGVHKSRAFFSPSEPVAHFNSLIYQQMRSHCKNRIRKTLLKLILDGFHMAYLNIFMYFYRVGWGRVVVDVLFFSRSISVIAFVRQRKLFSQGVTSLARASSYLRAQFHQNLVCIKVRES